MRGPRGDVEIQPDLRCFISGSTSWLRCSGAQTCTSIIRSKRFAGNSAIGRKNVTAALLTRMSTGPSCSRTVATSRSRSAASARLAATAIALPPAAVMRVDRLVNGAGQPRVGRPPSYAPSRPRPHPAAANRCAIAAPMPRLAPVTIATLPVRSGVDMTASFPYQLSQWVMVSGRRPLRRARTCRRCSTPAG